jgi:copper transport protein
MRQLLARRRMLAVTAILAGALVLPASAWAHAALLHTFPSASGVQNGQPHEVRLTFSEPVEPRFAIVSVTDANGTQQTTGRPARSTTDRDTLVTPVKDLPQGWYLVFWRAISADGHPVRGAFTFAIGPVPGPAPQFVIPSVSETAATPRLIGARWIVFLSLMVSVGLFVFRTIVARPLTRLVPGSSPRRVTVALALSLGIALLATPFYLLLSTAQFALRSWTEIGALVPLVRVSAFGRAFVDLEIALALFAVAVAVSILLERADRRQRSVVELLSQAGALAAGAAAILVVSLAGHAPQSAHRWITLPLDALHVSVGSIWLGGLVGLFVLWSGLRSQERTRALAVVVPRFSNTAFVSVLALIGTGTGNSLVYLPTLPSLWQTSYGKALIAKIALLGGTMLIAAVNLLRTKPGLRAAAARADEALGGSTATLLRRLVGAEVLIVTGAVLAAAWLTSFAPPARALAQVGTAKANVGPGPVKTTVTEGPYHLDVVVDPNRAALPNTFGLRISRDGTPVTGASVTVRFLMLDMDMGQFGYVLDEKSPGYYARSAPALVMVGHWAVRFQVTPRTGAPFEVTIVDKARG